MKLSAIGYKTVPVVRLIFHHHHTDIIIIDIGNRIFISCQQNRIHVHQSKARFKRRTLHVPNLMQTSKNNRFFSFELDSAHVKFHI